MIKLLLNTVFFVCFGVASVANAQETSTGVSIPVLLEEQADNGSVICSQQGGTGYKLCDSNYASSVLGVVTAKPAVSLGELTLDNEFFVITSGIAEIRISSFNGNIAEGDLLSTSTVKGVAQKASKNGFVLGSALTAYNADNLEDIGTVFVSINIHQTTGFTDVRTNLFEILREGLAAAVLTPLAALRYLLAAIVVVSSFVLAFIYFGKLAKAGIEGIARNPLAHRTIELTVIFHLAITLAIFLVGLGVAYLILVL